MKKFILISGIALLAVKAEAQTNSTVNGTSSQQPLNGNSATHRRLDNTNSTPIRQNTQEQRNATPVYNGQVDVTNKTLNTPVNNMPNSTNQLAPVNNIATPISSNPVNGAGNSNMNTLSMPSNGNNDNNGTSSNTLNTSNNK